MRTTFFILITMYTQDRDASESKRPVDIAVLLDASKQAKP